MPVKPYKTALKSKLLLWIGTLSITVVPLIMMLNGMLWPGLGRLAYFGSMFAGILLGGLLGQLTNDHLLKRSQEFGQQLAAAFACFGFLFLPALVGFWANAHFGTDIAIAPLWKHFLWACVGGAIFFWAKPKTPEP